MDQLCSGCCKFLHRADARVEGVQERMCTSIDPRGTLLLYQRAYLRTLRAENAELSRSLHKALVRARSSTSEPSRSLDISRTRDAGPAGCHRERPLARKKGNGAVEREGMRTSGFASTTGSVYVFPTSQKHSPHAQDNMCFVGRLASYKYFNMDQAILNALETFDPLGGSAGA